MRFLLAFLVVVFNLADNATTFLCLQAPVPGYHVIEANPFARWLFDTLGLLEGLALETFLTTAAVVFLVVSSRIPHSARLVLLGMLAVLPAWAAMHNLEVMQAIGLGFGAE